MSCASVHGGSWCTDSCLTPLVKPPHIFEWPLLDHPLRAAVIPVACAHFSTHFLPQVNVLWIRLDTALCEQTASLAMTFWGLLVEGDKDCLLHNCQASSLPRDYESLIWRFRRSLVQRRPLPPGRAPQTSTYLQKWLRCNGVMVLLASCVTPHCRAAGNQTSDPVGWWPLQPLSWMTAAVRVGGWLLS